jgi:tRNA dimethylallyltransferase
MKKIIVIVGPTGVGKTRLSVKLAKKIKGEVINADSMQVYRGLDIGTAKIKEVEKEKIKHHLFDICDVYKNYTIFNYQKDARKAISEITKKRKIPIFVGGSGLYIKAALYDYKLVNEKFHSEFTDMTNEEILNEIKKHYDTDIHVNNRKRLVRELNKIKNNSNNISNINEPLYDIVIVGLTTDRDKLYKIIDERVDRMIKEGLIKEVKELYDDNVQSKAIETGIGYKELYKYFNGEITLDEAIDLIKKNSRNFAKRQYTFFNHQMDVKWFDVNFDDFDNTVNEVYEYISNIK